jgi:hypothetical protein
LREYVRLTHRTEGRSLDRLTDLFNEDNTAHGGQYLDRPWQQFATLDARYHDLAYDITKCAAAALEEEGRLRANAPSTAPGSWKHDFMCAAITSSIELSTLRQPDAYGYIFHDEIIDRIGTFAFPVAISQNDAHGGLRTEEKVLRPDRVCGIRYKQTGAARIFLVEADCTTEPNNSKDTSRKSHKRSILQYLQFIDGGGYKKHFGESTRVMLLSVFAAEVKMNNVKDLLLRLSEGKGSAFMLFQAWPAFGRYFTPPKPRHELFTVAWSRAGYEPFSIDQL